MLSFVTKTKAYDESQFRLCARSLVELAAVGAGCQAETCVQSFISRLPLPRRAVRGFRVYSHVLLQFQITAFSVSGGQQVQVLRLAVISGYSTFN